MSDLISFVLYGAVGFIIGFMLGILITKGKNIYVKEIDNEDKF